MYVPKNVVTNDDLAKLMDTSDEWIRQRSGIEERRYASDDEAPSDLAVHAAKGALAQAGCEATDIDLIIHATLTPDYYFPGGGVFIQDKLGLETTPALDIRNQCSGFLYALSTAKAFIASGQYRRILLTCAETHSRGIDFSTRGRDVTVLFGDGAGALVLERSEPDAGQLLSVQLHSEGKHRDHLKMEFPSMHSKPFVTQKMLDENLIWPAMNGRYVFKNAVRRLLEVVGDVLKQNQLTPDAVDHFLFHQANLRINEAAMKEMGQPMEKSYNNIQKYGNCSAASIPICLAECVQAERFKKGDTICMASFGAGFTWGAAVFRW